MLEAKPMNRGDYNKYRGWPIPLDENPADEGYLIKYQDGYESWSPKDVFEEAYRDCTAFTFGIALELLKKGFKVAREGWNGKGIWLKLIKDWTVSFDYVEDVKGLCGLDFIAMKTAQDGFVPWIASQTDVLTEDWVIVE